VKLAEWLDSRTPRAPEALASRIRSALVPVLDHDVEAGSGRTHDELLAAAASLLSAAPGTESLERRAAHDLLAADALVTYAFEIAAEDPDTLDALAESAMRYFGALVVEGSS
jgi:hypothetical protein